MSNDIIPLEDTVAQHVRSAAKARGGTITPEQLVKDASRAKHPLHGHFEWDDAEAGRRFRIMQARVLISSCMLRFETSSGVQIVREFVNVEHGSSKFVSTEVVQTDADHKKLLIKRAHSELLSFKKRYGSVIDAFGSAIDEALVNAEAAMARVQKKKPEKKSKTTRRAA